MEFPAPLTVRDVSVELGCSEDDVRALIREGEIRTVACGIRPSLVPRHELDDYLRRLRVKRKGSGRRDVVVEAEDVLGVELPLDRA